MYVIVGASGFLGSYFIKNILEHTDEEILAVARMTKEDADRRIHWVSCDISNPDEVTILNRAFLSKISGKKIVYLAAYHNPDMVEKHPQFAWDVNVTSLSRFLNMVEDVKCFYYPSSDSVYGESANGYAFRENDALNPMNRYGMQKCVAEKLVTGYGYNVVRYPFLIGPSLLPQKEHFYDKIIRSITNGYPMQMFEDSYRSAISFDTAAHLVISLIENCAQEVPRILNVCGDEALSKYDIGVMIAQKFGISSELIQPVSILEDQNIFEAKRAVSTLMDNRMVKKILGLAEIKLSF